MAALAGWLARRARTSQEITPVGFEHRTSGSFEANKLDLDTLIRHELGSGVPGLTVAVLEDGKVVFDYRMREGVVERSNALALMRAIGLDV